MGAYSNVLQLVVGGEEKVVDVARNQITGPPRARVGEQVGFDGQVWLTAKADRVYDLYVDVYVNGRKVRDGLNMGTISPGQVYKHYKFYLVFEKPGTYSVRTYAYIYPHPGGRL